MSLHLSLQNTWNYYNKSMKKNILINLRVEEDLKDAFQKIADANGYTMSELLTASMKDVVNRKKIPIYLQSKLPNKNTPIITVQEIKIAVETVLLKMKFRDKINKVSLFGSYARGQMNRNSDIDLLVKAKDGITLFELSELSSSIEKETGKKTDITVDGDLDPYFKQIVDREKITIYEER